MKRLSRLTALLLTLAMLLSLVNIAHAEEKQSVTAWLLYFASNHETDSSKFPWWPQHKSADQPSSETGVEATNAEVTGPGMYTVGLKFNWQKAEGAIQFNLVLDNAESLFPGYYVKITDIRVNGKSINFTDVGFGAHYGDQYIQATDDYSIIYDDWMVENNSAPWNHKDWNGNVTDNVSAINPDDIKNGMTIDVDFFITSTAGKEPAKDTSSDPIWFPNNTASLAGLTLKDLGIADDWHAIVPVDLSKTGWQTFPLLAANFKQVGTAYVAVNNGSVTVTCEYNGFYVFEKSQCIKWFTSLDQISKAKLVDISNGLDCGSVVSIADDLGGAQMAYLSINNKITWRNPVDDFGNSLPDYWKNLPQWKEYRANLMEMINAANAE